MRENALNYCAGVRIGWFHPLLDTLSPYPRAHGFRVWINSAWHMLRP